MIDDDGLHFAAQQGAEKWDEFRWWRLRAGCEARGGDVATSLTTSNPFDSASLRSASLRAGFADGPQLPPAFWVAGNDRSSAKPVLRSDSDEGLSLSSHSLGTG